jgi:mono/diheme cytochrome c family protein
MIMFFNRLAKEGNRMKFALTIVAIGWVLLTQSVVFGASADSGQKMYVQYCSSCHGRDGRGSGSVSPFLKVKVPDLTLLRKRNKGVYPADVVTLAIDGRRTIRGHGDPKMPVWGEIFGREVKDPKVAEVVISQKEKMIADYVATLQR